MFIAAFKIMAYFMQWADSMHGGTGKEMRFILDWGTLKNTPAFRGFSETVALWCVA